MAGAVGDGVHYVDVDGVSVAFRVLGDRSGEDLVMISGSFLPVEALLEDRVATRFINGLGALGRLVLYDRRGVGLSDPFVDWSRSPLDQWAEDLIAVIDAADLEQPTLVAWDAFFGTARLVASRRPDLVGRLVLVNPLPFASSLRDWLQETGRDGVDAAPDLEAAAFPSRIDEPGFRDWLDRSGRTGVSPGVAARLWEAITTERDLTPPDLACPTLVLHRRDCMWPAASITHVANAIPNAELVQVDGIDSAPISGNIDPLIVEIGRFVTGAPKAPPPERVSVAVLFTDLVASTDRAVDDGDHQWRSVLDRHDSLVHSCVEQAGGHVIKFTGDGALAVMPSTYSAAVTAHSIKQRLTPLGLEIRAGIHLGDVDRRNDDISGIAVNIAARIMAEAHAAEVLVSDSARIALIGTNATFDDTRTAALKGVPGEWLIHRLREPPDTIR